MITLAELAHSQNKTFKGDGDVVLRAVATLINAGAEDIAFLANPNYTKYLENTAAGAVILDAKTAENYTGNALIAADPYVTFAHVAQFFQQAKHEGQQVEPGIHPSAVVSEAAEVAASVSVGPLTHIDAASKVADNCCIGSHVYIGQDVHIGEDCQIKSGVKIEAGTRIGDRVIVHPGAVIGADGFGLARDAQGWVKIPQTGVVEIGNDCEIGANTTIDCGAIENTVLGDDVRLDNQIQIGHNVQIGDHTVIAGCTAVAGSAKIGKNCFIGGGVGIVGHIEICDGVTIQAMALVTHSINQADSYSSVAPLQPTKQWRRNAVRAKQLDQLAKRVRLLEKKIND
ncbi:UDP-3-O-(3-hydroxymyristoyl)glucosamine N-acyltransferase [Marinicella sp. S1101]|uniref:UDP-3-O-(3-hydroxymyristoyl)glucosamine N-acyltransferase n=1 Tax=Marinicella marina TaxID=2996016 RepID=UPI0022610227|nr:UDP-3-O-(3-hydroxymyristoyl)glucosamine N-acyltransferase [Marinicella marina]MCX7554814.1 UDP-3-O-(3-hydroxymyristoyl)glucosamine N-acyltransferase [Marinicella marina]MDJ1140953.1 UDP-3-O-(3-hydroxymyristoyl)glucosamine N-acyltransferase [Marinicella marina]